MPTNNTDIDALVAEIESHRRAKRYSEMEHLIGVALLRLVRDDSALACHYRSRIAYEWSMACFQQANETLEEVWKRTWLVRALGHARTAVLEARAAGNLLDELFALMNISGLFLPALGRSEDGLQLSQNVSAKAMAIADATDDPEERELALRVVANSWIHQANIVISLDGDRTVVRDLLERLEENAYFQTRRMEPWAQTELAKIGRFLTD